VICIITELDDELILIDTDFGGMCNIQTTNIVRISLHTSAMFAVTIHITVLVKWITLSTCKSYIGYEIRILLIFSVSLP
jgi:hypothetical protein